MDPVKILPKDLSHLKITSDALQLLPIDFIKRHKVLRLEVTNEKLAVVMSDPTDQRVCATSRALPAMNCPSRPPIRSLSLLLLYHPKGCPLGQGAGYLGRRGIYELLIMNEAIRDLVHRNVSSAEIRAAALAEGMKTLRESGLDLVFQGVTTVDEVYRNTVE